MNENEDVDGDEENGKEREYPDYMEVDEVRAGGTVVPSDEY